MQADPSSLLIHSGALEPRSGNVSLASKQVRCSKRLALAVYMCTTLLLIAPFDSPKEES